MKILDDNLAIAADAPPPTAPSEPVDLNHSETEESSVGSDFLGSHSEANSFSERWTANLNALRRPILHVIQIIARHSATNPKRTIALVVALAFSMMGIGAFNFRAELSEDKLWTPRGSIVESHLNWLRDHSGFPQKPRSFLMVFHNDGDADILRRRHMELIFEALDTVRNVTGYDAICSKPDACEIQGITQFWNNSKSLFEEQARSDTNVTAPISVSFFPDTGAPVIDDLILGNSVRNEQGLLVSAQRHSLVLELPSAEQEDLKVLEAFEKEALEAILGLDRQWNADGVDFHVEVLAERSFADEFQRAIVNDLGLIPTVFILMGIFTSAVFFKRDKIQSRAVLGAMAVVSVLLSIVAGYGLLFACGVPQTAVSQLLVFVFFGVGLDDAFIITGAFFRIDPSMDIVDRTRKTMDEVGMSVFLTTLTSSLAFGLGCFSSIPAVYWLCLYAVPTMSFILFFQLSFFVACVVLDERRVAAGRPDKLSCISCGTPSTATGDDGSAVDRAMEAYAKKLINPFVKMFVLAAFTAITVACAFSATKMEVAFEITDVLAEDSYIRPFFGKLQTYHSASLVTSQAIFRNVDQSDPVIRQQMDTYINEMVTIDAIDDQPFFCWFRHFEQYVAQFGLGGLDFVEQLDTFLAEPLAHQLYNDHIVRRDDGTVETSRCIIMMGNIDVKDVGSQVDALLDQRKVTKNQPINQGVSEFNFFLFDPATFYIWEFYHKSSYEVLFTAISSITAVSFVTLILVPHYSAVLFVLPLITMLYVDLMGVMQWAGVSINPISYVVLVLSAGLLVDFLVHILLRYFEVTGTRKEKTIVMLRTMGSSILIGGLTTFLGTLPLAFSTSDLFRTVCIAFVGLVSLGATHGLVLLPVLLSICGPQEQLIVELHGRLSVRQSVITPSRRRSQVTKQHAFVKETLEV